MIRLYFGVYVFNELLQTNYKRKGFQICFVWKMIECTKHPMQTNFQITRRKAIKINDNGQYFDFIGGTLSYVTYVMS